MKKLMEKLSQKGPLAKTPIGKQMAKKLGKKK